MKAVTWAGKKKIEVVDVPTPGIEHPRDVVLRVTLTAICGSDLHLYDGYIPTMEEGDVLGHEFMGEIVEAGSEVTHVGVGDRVLVPFNIACGDCWFCKSELYSLCDKSNPNAAMAEKAYGHSPAGLFGYSHMFGGFAGGQAQYVRVPFADVGAFLIPEDLPDEKVLFLTDIFPTGYQAAENCNLRGGETVAVWGCGPVGQFAIRSALMLGAEQVIAIDDVPSRLEMAAQSGAIPINFKEMEVADKLAEYTGGRGPDACIDAVGLEAHGTSLDAVYDRIKVAAMMASDRIHVIREMVTCCRKGGTLSIPGVYGGYADKFPIGAIFGKGLTIRCGQTHTHHYVSRLMERIQKGDIDPSFVITHEFDLQNAADAYSMFSEKRDDCIKVVMHPGT